MSQWIQQYWLAIAHAVSLVALLAMCWRESRRADKWERAARSLASRQAFHDARTRVWHRN